MAKAMQDRMIAISPIFILVACQLVMGFSIGIGIEMLSVWFMKIVSVLIFVSFSVRHLDLSIRIVSPNADLLMMVLSEMKTLSMR